MQQIGLLAHLLSGEQCGLGKKKNGYAKQRAKKNEKRLIIRSTFNKSENIL